MKDDKDVKNNPTDTTADDVTFEATEEGEGEENSATALKKLREKLAKCVEEKQGYLNNWQRDKAEFLNARKRDEDRQKEIVKYANEDLILDLLPVLDSFEMAKSNTEAWEKVDKNWRIGIEYIQSQILGILQKNGLVELNPLGAEYSPLEHEAIEMIHLKDDAEGKAQDGKVLMVINKGYKLSDRVIRPPKVKVGEVKK